MRKIENIKRSIVVFVIFVLCIYSCIPVFDARIEIVFNNVTGDTLFIGASHSNRIDDVGYVVSPHYQSCDSDTISIFLWNGLNVSKDWVFPDSICLIDQSYLFAKSDTCYFFLIKRENALRYSWDEIRSQKLYRVWKTVKNKEGNFDKDIKY